MADHHVDLGGGRPVVLHQMWRKGKDLHVTRKRDFLPLETFDQGTVKSVLDFSYSMSFGSGGEHRRYRSGGTHLRKKGEVLANAFQGKLAEFAVYEQLRKKHAVSVPDLSTYGLGEWDSCDFAVGAMNISIKSTKKFGNLMLLEQEDWTADGRYVPNMDRGIQYDLFLMVRIEPSCEELLKKNRLLYSCSANKISLEALIETATWSYDIPGYATLADLKSAIDLRQMVHQGDMLNGSTRMDADNYYVQAGDLRPFESIHKLLRQD